MAKTISSSEKSRPSPNRSLDLTSAQQHNNQAIAQLTGLQPASGWQIVHVTTGRVRLRTTDSDLNSILDTIAQDLRQQDGVKKVSVNEQMGSLVVNFDENKLSLAQFLSLHPSLPIYQPQTAPEHASQTDPLAAWKSWNFWKEQSISLIPLMMGLAVTRGLGIQGWVSIPAYMIAADATRTVIGFLGSQASTLEKSKNPSTGCAITSDIIREDELSKIEGKSPTQQHRSTDNVDKASEMAAKSAKVSYSVVHTMPGRIRLKIEKIAQDYAYGRRLERLLKTDTQVTNVRVNINAASIAIAYHSPEIPLSHWVSLMELALETNPPTQSILTTANQPLLEQVSQAAEITDATTANQTSHMTETGEITDATTATDEKTSDLSSFWTNLKPPAMSFCLGIMANLALETMY
jgi:hypothetical protein